MGKHTNRRFCLGSWGALPIPLAYSQRLCGCCNGICGCFFAGSGQPFSAPWALWLIQSHTCLPCSFVSCWRRKLCCTSKALAALCIVAGRKVSFDFVLCSYMEPKPRQFLVGIIWGLWIAGCANYSPDLWGQPCRVSAISVSRRGFSPPEGCM